MELSAQKIIYDIAISLLCGTAAALLLAYMFYGHKVRKTIFGLLLDARNDLGYAEMSIKSPKHKHIGGRPDICDEKKAASYECYTYNADFIKTDLIDSLGRHIGRVSSIFWLTCPFLKTKMQYGDSRHFSSIISLCNRLKLSRPSGEYTDLYSDFGGIGTGFDADINMADYLLRTSAQICERYNKAYENFRKHFATGYVVEGGKKTLVIVVEPQYEQMDVDTVLEALEKHKSHIEEVIESFYITNLYKCVSIWAEIIRNICNC